MKHRADTALGLALIPILALGLGCARRAPPVRVLITSERPAAPPSLSFSPVSDRSVAVHLTTAAPAGVVTLQFRNSLTQSISSAALNATAVNAGEPLVVLPTPWNGELRITSGAQGKGLGESTFIGIVLEPIFPEAPGRPPRILYGPLGRSSVRFTQQTSPAAGTQIAFTSPADNSSPGETASDAVDIEFIPPLPKATTAVIGLSPWILPKPTALAVHVFDRKTGTWSALPSHTGRDGTVYATGPLPGIYVLKTEP